MKCYFTIDPLRGNKVLIPACYGSLHQEDLSCCTCKDFPTTPSQFERQSYNAKVDGLNKEIDELRVMVAALTKDNYHLIRIIEKVNKKS